MFTIFAYDLFKVKLKNVNYTSITYNWMEILLNIVVR